MPHNYETTRRHESETSPGVSIILKKMTEGRRLELRKNINIPNRRIRDILREQTSIEKQPDETRDNVKWLELQDEFDDLMIGTLNPAWIIWGVKQIEGLVVDGKPLGIEDWKDWPSTLFDEVLATVKAEAELNGAERKNLESPTTSGGPVALTPKASTVASVEDAGGGEAETVHSISRPM